MIRPIAIAAAVALAACTPKAPAPPPATQVKLHAIDCGRFDIKDADIFADDGSLKGVKRVGVNPCYLVRHPAGDLLWDTGLSDALADAPGGLDVGPAFHVTLAKKLSAQLGELGLTPADIEFVSFSHMHADHTGNGNLFAASTWLVDKNERDAMFSETARADTQAFDSYKALETARTTIIETDVHDVFGDGSVTIHRTPGHTPGHTVLLVKTAGAGNVLLTGDMWHLAESREKRLVPRFNFNRDMTLQSMDKVEALAAEANARVVRQHVPEDFASLPAFPAALE